MQVCCLLQPLVHDTDLAAQHEGGDAYESAPRVGIQKGRDDWRQRDGSTSDGREIIMA